MMSYTPASGQKKPTPIGIAISVTSPFGFSFSYTNLTSGCILLMYFLKALASLANKLLSTNYLTFFVS
jgi:hypothetical protein